MYSLTPDASSIEGDFAVFDVKTSMLIASNISSRLNSNFSWETFEHRNNMAWRFPLSWVLTRNWLDFTNINCINAALEYSSDSKPISVKRTLRGSSQAWGQLETVITNHSPVMVQVAYVETMPWLLQFYLHTLEARLNGIKTGSLTWFSMALSLTSRLDIR